MVENDMFFDMKPPYDEGRDLIVDKVNWSGQNE